MIFLTIRMIIDNAGIDFRQKKRNSMNPPVLVWARLRFVFKMAAGKTDEPAAHSNNGTSCNSEDLNDSDLTPLHIEDEKTFRLCDAILVIISLIAYLLDTLTGKDFLTQNFYGSCPCSLPATVPSRAVRHQSAEKDGFWFVYPLSFSFWSAIYFPLDPLFPSAMKLLLVLLSTLSFPISPTH